MVYEVEILIRRSDRSVLAADVEAVTALLSERKAARGGQSDQPPRPKLQLVGGTGTRG